MLNLYTLPVYIDAYSGNDVVELVHLRQLHAGAYHFPASITKIVILNVYYWMFFTYLFKFHLKIVKLEKFTKQN